MASLSSPLVGLVAVALVLAACGGGPEPTPVGPATPVATQLAFTVPPAELRRLDAFAAAPAVEIRDAAGARLGSSTANVTLTLAGGTTGATLRGTTTVAAVNGVATFPGLSIDSAGAGYTLVASSNGLTSATSPTFTVRGVPIVLAFRTQPVGGEAGAPFPTQPVVEIRDSATGAVLTDRRDTVALVISARPSNGVLAGTTRVAAVNGVATFTGLSIDVPGSGYELLATTAGAPAVTSSVFSVLSVPGQLTLVSGGGQFGAPSTPLPQLIRLRVSRPVVNTPIAGRTVTFTVAGGGSVSPTSAVSDQNGDVTTTWTLGASGQQTLIATASGSNDPLFVAASFPVPGLRLKQIVAGTSFFCGIQPITDGAVCWGDNSFGQLGNGPSATPGASARAVRVSGDPLSVIYAGYDNACGTNFEGALLCWGNNDRGQLGNGTVSNVPAPAPVPVADVGYTDLGIGSTHMCGIPNAPTTRCWGSNVSGERGSAGGTEPRPTAMSGAPRFRRIASGVEFSCGLDANDIIFCWGRNSTRQLGDGSSVASRNVAAPVQMPAGVTFGFLSVGFSNVCAISRQGRLFCWGANSVGQLGDGTTTLRPLPTPIAPNFTVRRVAVGFSHTCAIVDPGDAYCWGNNDTGALGDGTTVSRLAPGARVAGGHRWLDIAVSAMTSCGIEAQTLQVYCWGSAFRGALGDGFAIPDALALIPQRVIEPAP